MSIPAISKAQIADTLSKIRSIAGDASALDIGKNKAVTGSGFDQIMNAAKASLSSINATYMKAESIKEAHLNGDSNVSLPQVLVSSIKSKIAFEGLLVVRNKLIDAYKEIMNMPI